MPENTSNNKNLTNLLKGETGKVISVLGNDPVSRRLMEMGIVPGETVRVVKSAPFGDPMEIKVRGYHLAVRKAEARMIEIYDAA